jgi:hypothetical protein
MGGALFLLSSISFSLPQNVRQQSKMSKNHLCHNRHVGQKKGSNPQPSGSSKDSSSLQKEESTEEHLRESLTGIHTALLDGAC